MMPPPLIPPQPLRPNATQAEKRIYEIEVSHYLRAKRDREEVSKWELAVIVVMITGSMLAVLAAVVFVVLHVWGVRGISVLTFASAAIFGAVVWVRQRL